MVYKYHCLLKVAMLLWRKADCRAVAGNIQDNHETSSMPPKVSKRSKNDVAAAATAKSLQSCPTLCNPRDGSPPGSPVPGILQARTLEWVAISFSNAWKWKVKGKLPSRVQLFSDPMDYSLPGSSIHGIFQARVLEWGAILFSESFPRNRNFP